MVGDFWSIERRYWQFSAPASELYKTDAIIEHIKAQPEPGRVLSLLVQTPPSGRDPFLGGDAYMVHGLRLVTGYHGNQIGRYDKLYGAERQMQNLFNPVFWQVSNMKWIVYNDSTVIFPGTERVMGPVLNAAGTPIWLFKVPGENPAAWVTPAIMKQPDDVVESALNDPRFPAISVALFAPDAPVEGQQLSAAPAPLPIKTRTVVEPGHIVVELDKPAPAGSALMVAENYYPGWTATIDGQPAAVHRADLSLMGVSLPAGATKVELRFSSASYERGKLITLIGIGLALLLIGAGAIAQRRVARA
jgi:Bacterial membrane protein YfhO